MSRLTGMILIFVMINIFMFLWGIGSSNNIFVRYILNPNSVSLGDVFKETSTFLTIVAGVSTITGAAIGSSILLFGGVAYIFFSYSKMLIGALNVFPNPVLGWLIISPMMLLFWLIVLEWWKGD